MTKTNNLRFNAFTFSWYGGSKKRPALPREVSGNLKNSPFYVPKIKIRCGCKQEIVTWRHEPFAHVVVVIQQFKKNPVLWHSCFFQKKRISYTIYRFSNKIFSFVYVYKTPMKIFIFFFTNVKFFMRIFIGNENLHENFHSFFFSSFDDKYADSVLLLCPILFNWMVWVFFCTNSDGFIAYKTWELNFLMKIFMRFFIAHEDLHEDFH